MTTVKEYLKTFKEIPGIVPPALLIQDPFSKEVMFVSYMNMRGGRCECCQEEDVEDYIVLRVIKTTEFLAD